MAKKRIAIVAGGDSSEIGVSLKSAEGIYSFLNKDKYEPYIVILNRSGWKVQLPQAGGKTKETPIDKNDFSFREGEEIKHFALAYITIHGTPGENGLLQGYFELINLPYSSAGVLTSALTFDKYACNHYLQNFGVRISDSVRLEKGAAYSEKELLGRLGLPLFVKPNAGGSSFGISKVHAAGELPAAIRKAFAEDKEILLERFIAGTEVTCGCYCTRGKQVVFPPSEVISQHEFFDFDAKYNGASEEITPARLPADTLRQIQQLTLQIYAWLRAKGLIRVDYILDAEGRPTLLEVNTTPGMTSASFIPQQVRAAGLDMGEVLSDIIENELEDD
ncbi:MAG: D-alanine--D-alanine ligase [Tannerella sp.]|jgi:D-alanine-D-alanine ligase|nr:D-alanine--D-alanine ligase [Tannerella sp.]